MSCANYNGEVRSYLHPWKRSWWDSIPCKREKQRKVRFCNENYILIQCYTISLVLIHQTTGELGRAGALMVTELEGGEREF